MHVFVKGFEVDGFELEDGGIGQDELAFLVDEDVLWADSIMVAVEVVQEVQGSDHMVNHPQNFYLLVHRTHQFPVLMRQFIDRLVIK